MEVQDHGRGQGPKTRNHVATIFVDTFLAASGTSTKILAVYNPHVPGPAHLQEGIREWRARGVITHVEFREAGNTLRTTCGSGSHPGRRAGRQPGAARTGMVGAPEH